VYTNLIDKIVNFKDYAFRNVATIITSEDLLDDLSDNPEAREYGEALVAQQGQANAYYSPIIERPFAYGVAVSPGLVFSGIKTRFSDGARYGVWYGSLDVITTIYETVFHWVRFLSDSGFDNSQPVITERRVFKVLIAGILVDLIGKEADFPGLIAVDTYDFTHRLGNYLYDMGQKGLLVQSARNADGTNLASFTPDILSDPRHHLYVSYMRSEGRTSIAFGTAPEDRTTWSSIDAVKERGMVY
jgi:hypothetical protein